MIPDRKNHHLPFETYSSTDCKFFITICAYNKNDLFTSHNLCTAVVDALLWYHNNHTWNLYCYCLMPDHLHMIVSLPSRSMQSGVSAKSILTSIAQFKSYTTRQLWKYSETQNLWQRNCFDSVIDQLESVDDLIRYVLNNPVRKGIVDKWEDYPYSRMVSQP
ncbi:MAG: REP-associated tyrosine transposase [Armatimonadota bacterium]